MQPEMLHDADEWYLLTSAQRWHHDAISARPDLQTTIYSSYRLVGPLDPKSFTMALYNTVQRNDALRIGISSAPDGLARQRVRDTPSPQSLLTRKRVVAEGEGKFSTYARATLAADVWKPWDLTEGFPFRFRLLRYSSNLHAFLCSFSHVALDLRGCDLVLHDLWRDYERIVSQGIYVAEPRRLFARAAESHSEESAIRSSGGLRAASGVAPPHCQFNEEFVDDDPPASGTSAKLTLEAGRLGVIRERCHANNLTEFQGVVAALASVIFDISPQHVISIVIPVDTRRRAEHDVAGMFAVPVPIVLQRPRSGDELLNQIRREIYSATLLGQTDPARLAELCKVANDSASGQPYRIKAVYMYRSVTADEVHAGPIVAKQGSYAIPVQYESAGLEIQVISFPARLEISVFFAAELAADHTMRTVMASLETRLADPHWSHGLDETERR